MAKEAKVTVGSSGQKQKKSRHQTVVATFIAAVVILAVVAAVIVHRQAQDQESAEASPAAESDALVGGPFTLVDQDGRTVTDKDFLGKYLLIYFGYTYCPDVCPTTLNRNLEALDKLGPTATPIIPIMISIDPQRDTPGKLRDYIGFFDKRLVALTGTPEQVAGAAKAYRVYYAKAPGSTPENYLVDHSSITYLVGPNGKFVQHFSHAATPDDMAKRIAAIMAR